jgi:hypothetical protein
MVSAIFRDQDKFSTTAFDDQTVFAIKVTGASYSHPIRSRSAAICAV